MSACIPDGAVGEIPADKIVTGSFEIGGRVFRFRDCGTCAKAYDASLSCCPLCRVAALEAEVERQVRLVADWRGDHEDETTEEEATFLGCPWRKPTHGTCCTCQRCGADHDDCICMPSDAFFVAYNRLKAMPTEAEVVEAITKQCPDLVCGHNSDYRCLNCACDIETIRTLFARKAKEAE